MSKQQTWQTMDNAPNHVSILVAYDSGDVRFIHATDNDYAWIPWDGRRERGVEKPTHWHPIPSHPQASKMRRARAHAERMSKSI